MSTFQEIFSAAQSLDTADRIRLANAIWDGVPPEDWPLPNPEWITVAQQRSAAFDEGHMPAANWSDVQTRARRKAGLDE